MGECHLVLQELQSLAPHHQEAVPAEHMMSHGELGPSAATSREVGGGWAVRGSHSF